MKTGGDVVAIPLNFKSKRETLVDAEIYDIVKWHRWSCSGHYAARRQRADEAGGSSKRIYLHRFVYEFFNGAIPPGLVVDHINKDGYDNRRSNLRLVTVGENALNKRLRSDNKSGYRGVSFDKRRNRWIAAISRDGQQKNLGLYDTARSAALAYNIAAEQLHGRFAQFNEVF